MKRNIYINNRTTGECRNWEELSEEEKKELGRKLNLTMLKAAGATPVKHRTENKTI